MKNDNQDINFIKKCRNIDFSLESANREKNLEILKSKLKNIESERENVMNRKFRKPIILVAIVTALICFSGVIYGQELISILKAVTLGSYAGYYVIEDNHEAIPIPEELRGKVFDKDGVELEVVTEDCTLYNEDGIEVMPKFEDGKAILMTVEEFKAIRNQQNFITHDLEEGKGYFICDTLTPSYLPDGYTFDRIEYYMEPNSQEKLEPGTQKYMDIYYRNGEYEIYSQVRYMDEETAYSSTSTEDVQEIKINGYDAVIDRNTLDIQIGDVMYMFFGEGEFNNDELVKIAESLE